jgi:general secretion pathway protein D
MTVKTTLFTLFLTGCSLWAQTAAFPALPSGGPADGAPSGLGTNRDQALQQALRNALAGRTNAAAPGPAASPVQPAADTNSPASPPALQNPPRALPVTPPRRATLPNLPATSAAPGAGVPPSGPPGALAASPPGTAVPAKPANAATPAPAAANSALEAPLPEGIIDFRSADLTQVLEIYSQMVNRTILRPASLPAPTITLKTQGQLTMREGIQALEAVLGLNGITMINMGDKFVKAMPEAQGNSAGARFDTNSAAQLPELGQYVTRVVQLKFARPSELVAVLQPFVKIPNAILPVDGSQMLVLRDYTENIKRMLELVERIDVAIPSEFDSVVIPIKYAKASEIAGALNSLSSGGGGTTVGGGGGATTRSTRTSGMGMNRSGGMGGYPGQTMPGMGIQPGTTGTTPAGSPGSSSFSSRLQNIISKASASGEIVVLGQTKIISDERTNSLLIYASKEDMKTIQGIVAKLDVVLAQVLIDAAIISVELDDNRSLGFSYIEQQPHGGSYFKGLGAINNGNSLSQSPLVSAATNIANSLPGAFSYLGSFGQDLDVTVTAAAGNSRTKILQRPRIQTSHNEPANLFVGSTEPYPTSSYYGGGAYGGYSSIQQMQIGVSIEVTPLINPDGLVVMDIHTKIDDVTGSRSLANVGEVPITSSKEASSKVSVRDHDTIILGGMIYTKKKNGASGVPLLMDIPLLGYLFRSSNSDDKRSELIVLIRPTVLPTPEVAALAATAEKNKMPGVREFERESQADETRRLKQADKKDKMNSYQPLEKP